MNRNVQQEATAGARKILDRVEQSLPPQEDES